MGFLPGACNRRALPFTSPPPPSVAILFIYRRIKKKNTIQELRLYKFIRLAYSHLQKDDEEEEEGESGKVDSSSGEESSGSSDSPSTTDSSDSSTDSSDSS